MAPKSKFRGKGKKRSVGKSFKNPKKFHGAKNKKYSKNSSGMQTKPRYTDDFSSDRQGKPFSAKNTVISSANNSKKMKLGPFPNTTSKTNKLSAKEHKPQNVHSDVDSDNISSDEETMLETLRKNLGIKLVNNGSDDESNIEDFDPCSDNVASKQSSLNPPNVQSNFFNSETKNIPATDTLDNEFELTLQEKDDEADTNNFSDSFEKHFLSELHPNLLNGIEASAPELTKSTEFWPIHGEFRIEIPSCIKVESEEKIKTILEDDVCYTKGGSIPKLFNLKVNSPEDVFIKPQIVKNIVNNENKASDSALLSPFQSELFSIINNYQDLYYAKRLVQNSKDIRFIYCLHIMNHMLKTRTKILHHNAQLSNLDAVKKYEMDNKYRDQGLVRPKVLVLVPFKDNVHKIVGILKKLLFSGNSSNVSNNQRFEEEFTGNEIVMPYINQKPEDFVTTFSGNISDDFRIGICVTKKALKLFVDFYSADIIIASPLGLRRIIGAPGEPDRDFDFLASIELLILDQTEIFTMQNWDHVIHIFNHLHILPKESHGTDLSRVRMWSLNGRAKYYRQTLIFSSINLPVINSLFNKKCFNYAGRVKITPDFDSGSISQVIEQIPHRFYQFSSNNPLEDMDKRFDFFINTVLPHYHDGQLKQTVIFIPNYFDFVRLRNHFKKEFFSFTQICEYTSSGKVARARDLLFNTGIHFMLYTERFHFYNRIKLRGIRHLIFYQPPNFPHFYSELCNFLNKENVGRSDRHNTNFSVSVIYSKYDVNQLCAVVGSEKAYKMMRSNRTAHTMVTGD